MEEKFLGVCKIKLKIKIIVIVIILLTAINVFLYQFNEIISPQIVTFSSARVKERTTNIINRCILEEFNKNFHYDDVVKIEKDNEGNITMIKADTLEMNRIACEFAINTQNQLRKEKETEIKIPVGYFFKNNLIANYGPKVSVKAEPVGNVETEYSSEFESQGINQTRHKIYIIVKTNVQIMFPMNTCEITVRSEMPIAETIIIGKIPDTALQFDVKSAGFILPGKVSKN